MKAILVATGYDSLLQPLIYYQPTPLFRIADKPIIFFILECLKQHKIVDFEIILSYLPHKIESLLDGGKRWGINITFHLVKNPQYPFSAVSSIARKEKENEILLGRGDSLPFFKPESLKKSDNGLSTLMFYSAKNWSGWGIFDPSILSHIPSHLSEDDFIGCLTQYQQIQVKPFLSVRSFSDLLHSNFLIARMKKLSKLFPSLTKILQPGVVISPAVIIHPTVKMIPPIIIGENCEIKEHVQLGPYVIVENHCIIDRASKINHSLICQYSYIGEDLDISESIISRNLIINIPLETFITIRDDFILSVSLVPSWSRAVYYFLERFLASLLFVLLLPMFLFMLISHRILEQPMLQLPALRQESEWKVFRWLSFVRKDQSNLKGIGKYFFQLPTFINIIRGEAHFVGVSPRSIQAVKELPIDWKNLYLKAKVGLITLANLNRVDSEMTDELYASEAFYAVNMGIIFDLKLFLRWLRSLICKKIVKNS